MNRQVDIELLLDTIERLKDREKDIILKFYDNKRFILNDFKADRHVSQDLKLFVRMNCFISNTRTDYLKPILTLNIFTASMTLLSIAKLKSDWNTLLLRIGVQSFCISILSNRVYSVISLHKQPYSFIIGIMPQGSSSFNSTHLMFSLLSRGYLKEKIKHAYNEIESAYKKYAESQVDKVKERPVLNNAIKIALSAVPIIGPNLRDLYDNIGGSEEDKTQKILEFLMKLEQQNKEDFDRIVKDLNENKNIIIESIRENRITLADLISKSLGEILQQIVQFNLLQSNINIVTSESRFTEGSKDCWKTGYFAEGEVRSDYDARRPITDKIIESIENNFGTIIFGSPYSGKSVILKRIMFELIRSGYVILCGEHIIAPSELLQELLDNISRAYTRILFIADNIHESSAESILKTFNGFRHDRVKFLFAAREEQLNEESTPEVRLALDKIPRQAQYRLGFDEHDASLYLSKAINVTYNKEPSESEVRYGNELYSFSQKDPLMFVLGLKSFLSEGSKSLENFIELEMDRIMKSLDDQHQESMWSAAIFASLLAIPNVAVDLRTSMDLIACSGAYLNDFRLLSQENILLKRDGGADQLRIRHEKLAYEFLASLYKKRFGNSVQLFQQKYRINDVIAIALITKNTTTDKTTVKNRNTIYYLWNSAIYLQSSFAIAFITIHL